MTEPHAGPPGDPRPELDPDERRVAALLSDLADDPDAPPTAVSAASVLAAVHAKASAADTAGPVPALDVSVGATGPVGDGRKRFQGRRRMVLVGVLAAACVGAVAAVVIPLALRPSATTTSAESALNSAQVSSRERTAAAAQGGQAPDQSAADQSAADQSAAASGPVAAQPPEVYSGQADAALPTETPASAAAGGNAAGSAACAWSPLSAEAATALTQSLPPGRFAAPGELIAGCPAEPVAGARLLDVTGGSLVVTVVNAPVGGCASGSTPSAATEAGIRCVPQGPGLYLATEPTGLQTAYAYANGREVAVGTDRSATGLPEGDPLTAEQLLAAAQAVLAAVG